MLRAIVIVMLGAVMAGAQPGPSPSARPARFEDQVAPEAEWLAKNLGGLRYKADFTPASLWELDRFISEGFPGGEPLPRLQRDVGRIIFGAGAYTGEVLRRAKGGRWHWGGPPDAPERELEVELRVKDGPALKPMVRSLGRIREGFTASLAEYGREHGLDVGAAPAWTRSAWSRKPAGSK